MPQVVIDDGTNDSGMHGHIRYACYFIWVPGMPFAIPWWVAEDE